MGRFWQELQDMASSLYAQPGQVLTSNRYFDAASGISIEAPAIEWLKEASQQAVAGQMGLSWEEIHGILERAVERGLGRRQAEQIEQIGGTKRTTGKAIAT